MEDAGTIIFVIIGAYMLPGFIALGRNHRLKSSIFVVNSFMGWSFIGWIVALAIAASPPGEKAPAHQHRDIEPPSTST